MNFEIPALLLSIPAPVIDAKYFDANGRLQLSLEDAAKLRKDYFASVGSHLRSNTLSLEHEIVPAVDCALRLFNAENFTGELSPAERAHFAEVYDRFGAAPLPSTAPPDSHGATADEALALEANKPIRPAAKDAYLQRLLASDGEMASACVRLSGLLLCVLAVVTTEEETGGDGKAVSYLFPYTNPWRLRAHMRHQLCLLHRAHSVFLEISSCIDACMALDDADVSVGTLLEVGHAQSYYHRRDLATSSFRRAMVKSGLTLTEDAMMGVRTRWQQQQYVQMVVEARSTRPVPPESTTEEQPKVILAEKDGHDLLDRPRERPEAEAAQLTPLHPEDKAIVLALCMDIRNNNPYHGLTQHHMQTYVERLLSDPAPAPFAIRTQTLLIRARVESNRNRVQERSFLQLTELVDQYASARDPHHSRFERTKSEYLYCVAYPPVWSLKVEYADLCFEESLYKTAVDVYEQVLDWEKIVECCKKLDKRKRAESLARDLLETDPSNPLLWVALGEATHEDAHLWKAWELCHHNMAAPMRALARLALEREHYDKVVEYFDKAVKINPLFGGDWFSLGYASLKLKLWERGGEAFTRVCQIDPNDAFAWNNLGSILLRDGKLRPAFNAMSQALRNNRRDWRMWQNYFQIGCQLKEVVETTNALNIAMTIAKRNLYLDRESMDAFVDNAIAYAKGEIPGSSAEAEENAAVRSADAVSYKSMAPAARPETAAQEEEEESSRTQAAAEPIEHLPISALATADEEATQEGHDDGLGDLVPLGADEDLTRDEVYAAARRDEVVAVTRPAAATAATAATQLAIRQRHVQRVRALFTDLLELFVSNPDLYSCAARFFRFADGPLAAFQYRLKELRACRQKDQWERDAEPFARTVECLTSMSADASAAFVLAQDEAEHPPAATVAAAQTLADAAGAGDAGATAGDRASCDPDAVISALKDTLNNIKAVLEATEEHMQGTEKYESLRLLSKSVLSVLQEAKAAFV